MITPADNAPAADANAPACMVRTVLGDIPAAALGPCDAHEHVIIERGYVTRQWPDLAIDEVDRAVSELVALYEAGGRAVVDTMPIGDGRNVSKLVEVSRRTGVHIIAPTGLHLEKYYPPGDPRLSLDVDDLAATFEAEITRGIDATGHRAGIIKIATGETITPVQHRAFIAAAMTHRRTGCPIITHTEGGKAALQQADLLINQGVQPRSVTLSHVDRITVAAYHRDILQTGVCLAYDGPCRQTPGRSGSLPSVDLIAQLLPEFPEQIMVAMDAARRRYRTSYGGSPGLAWLFSGLRTCLLDAGLTTPLLDRLYIANPAAAFAMTAAPHRSPSVTSEEL